MRALALSLVLLALGVTRARAAPPRLTAVGIFGETSVVPGFDNDLVVRVTADATSAFHGEIVVEDEGYDASSIHTHVPLELSPGQTRELVVSVPGVENSYGFLVRLVERGATVRSTHLAERSTARRAFVVLAEPPRIRAATDAILAAQSPSGGYIAPSDRLSVGVVGVERRSGDPRVPRTHFGWAGVELVIATTEQLDQLDARGRTALRDHVLAGGTMLVFPGDVQDLTRASVRELTGALSPAVPRDVSPSSYLPASVAPCRYEGADVVRAEPWGVSVRRGFGLVHVACFDGNAPEHAQSAATRALIEALHDEVGRVRGAVLPQGIASAGATGSESQLDLLRRALDANEGARPVLPLVAIVLVLYVVLVGPIGFGWAERRGRPTLALVTTPALAAGCLVLLLAMGAMAKGFAHRARSAALVEVPAGERRAVERRISSLFFGRPMSPDLTAPPHARVVPVLSTGVTTLDAHGERPVLDAFRGGLWSTRVVRTDRMLDLGGEVVTEFEGTLLERVTNRTRYALTGAVVIDALGNCYAIGDLPRGATKPVKATPVVCADSSGMPYELDATVLDPLAELLHVTRPQRRILNGLVAYTGRMHAAGSLVVLARIEDEGGVESPRFASEQSLRLLRVVVPVPIDRLRDVVRTPMGEAEGGTP